MDGIKRLEEMIKNQKDKALIKVVSFLMQQTDIETAFLKEEKNLKDMAEYIKGLARKKAINGVAMIEDDVVYGWAKDYFIKSNKELGIKKEKVKKLETTKENNNEINDEFGSIFEEENIEKQDTKKDVEQISLFAG